MIKHTKHAAAAIIAAAILAGCGQGALTTQFAADGPADGMRGLAGGGKGGMKGDHGGMKGGQGGPMGLLQLADLTDEQKAQIQAIEEKYRPARPHAIASAKPVNKVAELLAAEALDVDALQAALAERPARPARPAHTAMLAELRAVLSEAQRAAIVARLEARTAPASAYAPTDRPSPPSVDARVAEVAARHSLNADQQAKLAAFFTALEATRPAHERPDFAAHQAAELAFWRTGDTTALAALEPPAAEPAAFPVDQFVALAQALTPEQRAQILARGPVGGPGGHHGGRGGRFGGGHGKGGFGH